VPDVRRAMPGRTPTSMWWLGGGRCARCPTFPDDGSCTVAVTDSWAPPGDLTNAVEVADGDDVQGGGGDWWRCRALCACGWRHDTTSTAVAWRRAWEHLGQWDRIVHQPVLPPSAFDQDGSLRQPKKKDAGLAALLDSVDRTLPLLTAIDAAGDEFDRAVRDLSAFCNRCAPVVMDGRWHWCARDPAHPGRCTCWCQWSVDCGHGHHGGCDGRDRVTADYHQEPDGTCRCPCHGVLPDDALAALAVYWELLPEWGRDHRLNVRLRGLLGVRDAPPAEATAQGSLF
jgi:hypothetical protein